MKGRKNRASGGVIPEDRKTSMVYAGKDSNVVKEAEERKRGGGVRKKHKHGGAIEGEKAKHRLDRPGRKSGGRVGCDKAPMTGAHKMSARPGESFSAVEGDEG